MGQLFIRPYQAADRAAVHQIAADTAFFGEPVEAFLESRALFCQIFYAYYTDLEPEHGWVACVDEEVVGFLMGCVDTARQPRLWARHILPRFLGNLVRGRYRLGKLTRRYIFNVARAGLSGELPQVDLALYPGHLHLNVAARWRGHGLGRRLLEAYLAQLSRLNVIGVHLGTTSRNEVAARLYVRMGFRELAARPTCLWSHLVDQPVQNLRFGLRLKS